MLPLLVSLLLLLLLQVRTSDYDSPMVFNCQMGAGRTTTGCVIGGLLAVYGHGHPAALLPGAGPSAGGSITQPGAAALVAATRVSLPAPIATAAGRPAPGSSAGPDAGVLVAGLNEGQSRDILREEIAGDSPRCSGGFVVLRRQGAEGIM